jgi:hypothetical protein
MISTPIWNPITLRLRNPLRDLLHSDEPKPNPSTATWVILGSVLAVGVGVLVFFSTRKAAAASSGASAFSISGDCQTITVRSESDARTAGTAAALAVRPALSDPALGALKQALAIVIPGCDWTNPPADRAFVMGADRIEWSQIETILAGKTVGDLTQLMGVPEPGFEVPTPAGASLPGWLVAALTTPPGVLGMGLAPGTRY